ncbi:hypothetical protein CURTO8I2_280141 [Curtobacterium sp. 8I-2]|nr:hypothetical protein CURTO8I2_280141 [Curtobacterium sp. 8I-2]
MVRESVRHQRPFLESLLRGSVAFVSRVDWRDERRPSII